jgi:hypothetical protein
MITFFIKKLSLPLQKDVVASVGNFQASREAENLSISLYSFFGKYVEVAYNVMDKSIVSVTFITKIETANLYSNLFK